MKITPYLEELIWQGKAEYKTRMIGGATTWLQKIPKDNFIILLGYDFQGVRNVQVGGAANFTAAFTYGNLNNQGTYQVTISTKRGRIYNRVIQNAVKQSVWFDGVNSNMILTPETVKEDFYLICDEYLGIQAANWVGSQPVPGATISGAGIPQVNQLDPINTEVTQTVTGVPVAGPVGLNPLGQIGLEAGIPGTTEASDELIISNIAPNTKRNGSLATPTTLCIHYVQCLFPKPSTLG